MKSLANGILLMSIISCSFAPIKNVNYKKNNLYSSDNAGNFRYTDLGPVHSKVSGSILASCESLAKNATQEITLMSKSMGGNAVTGTKWSAENNYSPMPTCKTEWGWGALGGVGLFLPWTRSVEVFGTAVKIDDTITGVRELSSSLDE